ncbi:unnamed protein product [Rotaria socialis]|uniref:G protein-coupled receptor n=1 Tax=Rotaria socialis TaxID=392032 RepID=A0A820TRE1_9BILA|nr:unnamed protein product [Rotaria socialis]CAF4469999.1 unnamed protein product [Rotaria socialis]
MIIAIPIVIIEQSPCLFVYNHVKISTINIVTCTILNESFIRFNTSFDYLIVGNFFPYSIAFTFGLMAYRNMQELSYRTAPLVRPELDKQLPVMVLIQVICTVFSIFPSLVAYLIFVYGSIQDLVIVARLRIAYVVMTCFYYSYFAVSV